MTKRIELIDALRGLAVCLMVLHHLMYDLVVFLGAPGWLFSCPPIDFLHYVFAGLFILLCGVSSRFSRSNVKRGLKTALVALVITAVTCFMDMDIIWGVLHLLAFCMLTYGVGAWLFARLPEKLRSIRLPNWLVPALCIIGLLWAIWATGIQRELTDSIGGFIMWILGLGTGPWRSSDYFPILPWVFVFLFGTWLGGPIKDGRFPKWFYETKVPFFPWVGRKSLLIYVLHQPVLYGIVMAIRHFVM